MSRIEQSIINNLCFNDEYVRKTIPFLKSDYFHEQNEKTIFEIIDEYIQKYNGCPSTSAILIELSNKNNISEQQYKDAQKIVDDIVKDDTDLEWLVEKTEQFCQEKAVHNAIMSSIQIIGDEKGKVSKGSIPQLLTDALAISFDTHIGHDFIDSSDERYEFYHKKENKIPFDIDLLNKITDGGLSNKTLNVLLASCVHPDTKVKIRYRKINNNKLL